VPASADIGSDRLLWLETNAADFGRDPAEGEIDDLLADADRFEGLRALAFIDAGFISNNNPNGGTKPSSDKLRSVGLGLRYNIGNFALNADYGRLITGSNVPLSINSNAPQKGDGKLNVNASVRF